MHHFTPPPGSPDLTSFYTLWTNYLLTLTPFYPRWKPNAVQKDVWVLSGNFLKKFLPLQPHPNIIFPPPPPYEKDIHSILHHFTQSEQINPSFLHHFTPGRTALTSIYPLGTIYPLTLTPFLPLWKPNAVQKDVKVLSCIFLKKFLPLRTHSYNILPPPPLNKLSPQSYIILPPGQLIFCNILPLWTN